MANILEKNPEKIDKGLPKIPVDISDKIDDKKVDPTKLLNQPIKPDLNLGLPKFSVDISNKIFDKFQMGPKTPENNEKGLSKISGDNSNKMIDKIQSGLKTPEKIQKDLPKIKTQENIQDKFPIFFPEYFPIYNPEKFPMNSQLKSIVVENFVNEFIDQLLSRFKQSLLPSLPIFNWQNFDYAQVNQFLGQFDQQKKPRIECIYTKISRFDQIRRETRKFSRF